MTNGCNVHRVAVCAGAGAQTQDKHKVHPLACEAAVF
jgi:hypothetical protein